MTDSKAPEDLAELIDKLRDIPTLSVVVTRVMELVNDPRTSAPQIADVLKRDQVLTAKVLRLVNSSFYNLSNPVTDVSRALAFLGFNTISMLVLGTSVFSSFEIKAVPGFNVLHFWKHSLAVAIAAECIARKINLPKPENCFTCGLLHDLGKMALFKVDPEMLARVVAQAARDGSSFLDAEAKLGLPGHTVMGERLAEHWKLPLIIRKAIRYHHRDIEPLESVYADMKPVIMVVTVANTLAKRLELGSSGDTLRPEYPANYLKALNLKPEHLEEIEVSMLNEMDRAQAFLSAARAA